MKNEIHEYIQSIAIPRFIGSQGNDQSKDTIIKWCKKLTKSEILIDPFNFNKLAEKISIVFLTIGYFLLSLIVFLGVLYNNNLLIFSGILVTTIWIILFFNFWIEIFDIIGRFGKTNCSNIIIKFGNQKSKDKLLICAHRDSLSSKPHGTKYFGSFYFRFFKLPLTISLLSMIAVVFSSIVNPIIGVTFVIVNLLMIHFAAITRFENESPGAYDNGTGIAILIHLVSWLSKREISEKEVWIAFLDAEEAGYGGSIHLAKNLPKEFDVLNIDGIGSGDLEMIVADGPLYSNTSKKMNEKIIKIGSDFGIKIGRYWSKIYPGSDHVSFVKKGFNSTSFTSSSFNIHSKDDTIEKIDFNQIDSSLPVLKKFIEEY